MRKSFVLIIIFYSALFCITLFQKTGRVDLNIVLTACDRLLEGKPIYVLEDSQEHTKPPLGTLLFLPLAYFDRFWVERIWDGGIFFLFFFLSQFFLKKISRRSSFLNVEIGILGLALTFNCWNSELRTGQFNALLLWFVLGSVSASSPWVRGACLTIPVIFKPTNLLFLPWIWRHSIERKRTLFGACLFVTLLCTVYIFLFGGDRFWMDHLSWWKSAPLSAVKHIDRYDNHGLPSVLSNWISSRHLSSFVFLLGILTSLWILRKEKDKWQSLSYLCLIVVFFSPMAWLQNYVLMLPYLYYVLDDYFAESPGLKKKLLGASLLSVFLGFGLWNPTTSFFFKQLWPFRPVVLGFLFSCFFWFLAKRLPKTRNQILTKSSLDSLQILKRLPSEC